MNHLQIKHAAFSSGVIAAAALAIAWTTRARSEEAKPGWAELTVELKIAGELPLPYQAVRVRCSLINRTKATISEPNPSTNVLSDVEPRGIRRPGTPHGEHISHVIVIDDLEAPVYITAGSGLLEVKLVLRSRDQMSDSAAVAASYFHERYLGDPLFTVPGDYVLKYENGFRTKNGEWISYPIGITCRAPAGADKEIVDLLAKRPGLRGVMMSPVVAADLDSRDELRSFIDRYPSSSYADFARFALARCYLRGVGYHLWQQAERNMRGYAKGIHDTLVDPKFREDLDPQLLRGRVFGDSIFGWKKQESAIIATAISARKAAPQQLDAAVERLAAFSRISKEDRGKAIKLLEDIKTKDFAYRPNALILLAVALRGVDPWAQEAYERRRAAQLKLNPTQSGIPSDRRLRALSLEPMDEPGRIEKIADELNRDFPDSREWIKERLLVAKSAEEVLRFRIHDSAGAKN